MAISHLLFECKAADDYLFWDGIHPTRAVHAIVAQGAEVALAKRGHG